MKLTYQELKEIKENLLDWIKESMAKIGAKNAVLGISAGKDSTVVAKLLSLALGPDHVYGIMLPDSKQKDLEEGIEICQSFGINYEILNIGPSKEALLDQMENIGMKLSKQSMLNIPPRLRMTFLFAYAQSLDSALVINTSNLSESWIGYSTVYGDTAGAFSPLGDLTSDEVVQLGLYLGIDKKFVEKAPADGLTGKTDEDVLGFSYKDLNTYIRTGHLEDEDLARKIDKMHKNSRFKYEKMPVFASRLKKGGK